MAIDIIMMRCNRVEKEPKMKTRPFRALVVSAVLASGIMGCAAFDSPRRTQTICASQGMVMYDRSMDEEPRTLTQEDREFLLRNNHVHIRCVTVPAR